MSLREETRTLGEELDRLADELDALDAALDAAEDGTSTTELIETETFIRDGVK